MRAVSGFGHVLRPIELLIARQKKPPVCRVSLGVVLTTIKSVSLEERGCVLVLKAPPVDPPVIIFCRLSVCSLQVLALTEAFAILTKRKLVLIHTAYLCFNFSKQQSCCLIYFAITSVYLILKENNSNFTRGID